MAPGDLSFKQSPGDVKAQSGLETTDLGSMAPALSSPNPLHPNPRCLLSGLPCRGGVSSASLVFRKRRTVLKRVRVLWSKNRLSILAMPLSAMQPLVLSIAQTT